MGHGAIAPSTMICELLMGIGSAARQVSNLADFRVFTIKAVRLFRKLGVFATRSMLLLIAGWSEWVHRITAVAKREPMGHRDRLQLKDSIQWPRIHTTCSQC